MLRCTDCGASIEETENKLICDSCGGNEFEEIFDNLKERILIQFENDTPIGYAFNTATTETTTINLANINWNDITIAE